MITVRKLASLAPRTRLRKAARMLEGWVRTASPPGERYLDDFLALLADDAAAPYQVRTLASRFRANVAGARPGGGRSSETVASGEALVRVLDDLRHALLAELGAEPAEWDLLPPVASPVRAAGSAGATADAVNDGAWPRLEGVGLYLDSIRSPFNVGSIVRTAAAFGLTVVGASEDTPPTDHPRVARSAMGATSAVEVIRGGVGAVLERCGRPLIALEGGGESIHSFRFPAGGVIVLGSEEFGVQPALLARADARVTIPMTGVKASLNVSVACGIALAAWQASAYRGDGPTNR